MLRNPAGYLSCGVFYCLFFSLLHIPAVAASPLLEPFATRDQNPLVMMYGLPLPTPAALPEAGHSRVSTSFNISNTLNVEQPANASLRVDAESSQLNLIYEQAINTRWSGRAVLPFISHSPGYFDSWIDNFHQALNLREGERPSYPQDELHITVVNGANTLLDIQQRQKGIGDIMLQAGYQLERDATRAMSLWTSLKLPSGDSDALTGSGGTDVAIWLAMQQQSSATLGVFAQIGGLYMSDSDILSPWHKNFALFGNAGFGWQTWERVLLKAQLDMHSALYDINMDFIGADVVQITFGGSILFASDSVLDIAMSEDIRFGASPDVTLNITWSTTF